MDTQALALAITKALAYTENGGKPDANNEKAGRSGELKSIFQFEPATWKTYSKEVTGQDNLPLTPENEGGVVYSKVTSWLKQGYNTMQIASLWNAGQPDAYKDNIGTNKEGVAFNTPEYAKKVQAYTDQFMNEPSPQQASGQHPEQDPNMQKLMAIAEQAKQNPPADSQPQGQGQSPLPLQNVNGGANFSTPPSSQGMLPQLAQQNAIG